MWCFGPPSPSPTRTASSHSACAGSATALGVEAMSLYNHVAGKEDILDGIIELVVEEFDLPADGTDWKSALRQSALSEHAARCCVTAGPRASSSRDLPAPDRALAPFGCDRANDASSGVLDRAHAPRLPRPRLLHRGLHRAGGEHTERARPVADARRRVPARLPQRGVSPLRRARHVPRGVGRSTTRATSSSGSTSSSTASSGPRPSSRLGRQPDRVHGRASARWWAGRAIAALLVPALRYRGRAWHSGSVSSAHSFVRARPTGLAPMTRRSGWR